MKKTTKTCGFYERPEHALISIGLRTGQGHPKAARALSSGARPDRKRHALQFEGEKLSALRSFQRGLIGHCMGFGFVRGAPSQMFESCRLWEFGFVCYPSEGCSILSQTDKQTHTHRESYTGLQTPANLWCLRENTMCIYIYMYTIIL